VTFRLAGDTIALHHFGNEAAWWRNFGVDPTVTARALWLETHPLRVAADEVGLARRAT